MRHPNVPPNRPIFDNEMLTWPSSGRIRKVGRRASTNTLRVSAVSYTHWQLFPHLREGMHISSTIRTHVDPSLANLRDWHCMPWQVTSSSAGELCSYLGNKTTFGGFSTPHSSSVPSYCDDKTEASLTSLASFHYRGVHAWSRRAKALKISH